MARGACELYRAHMKIAIIASVDQADTTVLRRILDGPAPLVPFTTLPLDDAGFAIAELATGGLMIVEAGGAIARRAADTFQLEECGPSANELLEAIREIEDRSGASLEVELTEHHFSEPFVIASGDPSRVRKAASLLGFSMRSDGRFFHLGRRRREGQAVKRLRQSEGWDAVIGIGQSELDVRFLAQCDVAILVAAENGPRSELPEARTAESWRTAASLALDLVRQLTRGNSARGRSRPDPSERAASVPAQELRRS
jgi:hypothetical protein